MAEISLAAEPGREVGSRSSKRLRRAGRIPAVVYGHGMEALAISVDARELRQALSTPSGLNQLLSLEVGPTSHLALARVLQRHPVRHTVVHVDFQVVGRDEIVSADVPVVLAGEAKAVEAERGVVEHALTSLTVNANPGNIPGEIVVDVSDLTVGATIRVGDLRLPAGVTTDADPDETVVLAAPSAITRQIEAAEAEPGEAAGGSEGSAAGQG